MILGFHGASQRPLGTILEAGTKKASKRKINQSCFGSYFWSFLIPNRVFLHFLRVIFLLVFGITFGRPLVPFLRIWGSFQGAFWDHFQDFFADAAKLKKCNLFKRNAWFTRCWASVLASFLLTF